MNDRQSSDRVLNDALRTIADEDARAGASAAVEAHVMAEFRSVAVARRRRVRARVALLAAAAALAIAAAIPLWRSQTSRREVTTAFMPLTYGGVPIVDGHVVRMEVPRASLASFGLAPAESAEGAASSTVLADVIIGDDGLARAVRFVRRVGPRDRQQSIEDRQR